ncbi:MAG: class I SAM-dependent methyltransferase [Acidimicrobiales bacterium]
MARSLDAALRDYYDQDAPRRLKRGRAPLRRRLQETFLDLLRTENRTRILELGCGPGLDASAFQTGGLRPVGLDLSVEHARMAAAGGVPALQGSLFAPPFKPSVFEAAWTMSTLVHVPDARFDDAMRAITASVEPGAPIGIGLWGGYDDEGQNLTDVIEPPRFFSHRSHDRAVAMLDRHGEVISFETQAFDQLDEEYQFAILRTRRHGPSSKR